MHEQCMNKSEQATTAQANRVMDPSFLSCDAIEVVEFGLVIVECDVAQVESST